MSVPDKQKNYPLSAKCYVSMATHLQLLFLKVILFANETRATIADLERVDNSLCCDRGSEGAYFSSLTEPPPPLPPFHRLDSFKWPLLLESCQRVHGWTGMWVSACQVENEIAVRRWRLNSVFNAWRVSEGAAQKKRGDTEMKVKALWPCQKIGMRCINMPESAHLRCNKGDLLSPSWLFIFLCILKTLKVPY